MKQICVISQEGDGALARLTDLLARNGINIETLDAEVHDGALVASLTVDLYDVALQVITRADFRAISEEAVLVRLEDRPGALAGLMHTLAEHDLHPHSLRILHRGDGWSLVAVAVPRSDKLKELLGEMIIS